MNRNELIEELKSKTFKLGSGGFIRLVDVMGSDSAVVQAARVSYGEGTKTPSDDRSLIRYLMRHRHTTPFEMAQVKIHLRIPMDSWRQFVRHRTASINEYSTRYSEAIDDRATTDPKEWRLQSEVNRQGSSKTLENWPEGYEVKELGPQNFHVGCLEAFGSIPTPGEYLTQIEEQHQRSAQEVYTERLKFGIAREQARKDLPLSTYTEAYWLCDLHNIFHFLGLRMEKHAQLEIREYANVMGETIIKSLFPLAWEAFVDYRLEAVNLSRNDMDAIRAVLGQTSVKEFGDLRVVSSIANQEIEGKRELSEFIEKWKKIVGYHEISNI